MKGYATDSLITTHSIVSKVQNIEEVMSMFDGITYAKGMSVL